MSGKIKKLAEIFMPRMVEDGTFPRYNGLAGDRPNQILTQPGRVVDGDYYQSVYGDSYSSGADGIFPDAQGMSIEQRAILMKNPWLAMDYYPHDSVMPASK